MVQTLRPKSENTNILAESEDEADDSRNKYTRMFKHSPAKQQIAGRNANITKLLLAFQRAVSQLIAVEN